MKKRGLNNHRKPSRAPLCVLRHCVLLLGFLLSVFSSVAVSEPRLFRIGTGGNAGTYFPIGSLIADALSHRGSIDNETQVVVPNLLVLAQRSSGSVANVTEIQKGELESGLAQADVAHWAFNGTGPFNDKAPLNKLRTVASLYLESVHLVARADTRIANITDLAGHRVSVDEIGSGTQLDVRPIMQAVDLSIEDIKEVYLKPTDAIDRMRKNQLDAFFIVAGYPVTGVASLVEEGVARVIPITGPRIDTLLDDSPFFVLDTIPANTYANTDAITTVAVAAQWIVSADLDEDFVYRLTHMLWSDSTYQFLFSGHPKGREVNLTTALVGIGIPLHPGAERYYRENGLSTTQLPR